MTKLLSFHGDIEIKNKFVSRLEEHRRLEHLIQGTGWEANTGESPKGCAVGCTLENYSHSQYPIQLGLPEWLARLEDYLFEALPKGEAEKFAIDLLNVIPVGIDVESVRYKLAVLRLEKALERLKDNKEPYATECRNAINMVITWNNQMIHGFESEESARSAAMSARSAAMSAAMSARSAARSAESAAMSAMSARSARSARSAAMSAAESAWSAWSAESAAMSARSAAMSAWSAADYVKWEAESLLKLLSECQ